MDGDESQRRKTQIPEKIKTGQGIAVHHFDENYYVNLTHKYPIHSIVSSFDLMEYVVQYKVEDKIKTKKFKASSKPLIVDGESHVEIRARQYYKLQKNGELKKSNGYFEDEYRVHVKKTPTPSYERQKTVYKYVSRSEPRTHGLR
jgi:hypothetical protein